MEIILKEAVVSLWGYYREILPGRILKYQGSRCPRRDSNQAFSRFKSNAFSPHRRLGFYDLKCYDSICFKGLRFCGLKTEFHNGIYVNCVHLYGVRTEMESTPLCDCLFKSRPSKTTSIRLYMKIKPARGSFCICNGKYQTRCRIKYWTITADLQNQKC
jgi:hypothetical protein